MTSKPIRDLEARQRALDPTQSFIVQAPAGSGKTELLIQRYLTLLSRVESPEEILAITFTKKAANEMRHRIISALALAANEPMPPEPHRQHTWRIAKAVLDNDAKRGWHLIDNPNQCRIQTIDALCTHLTGQLPLLSQFGASPSLSDDPSALYHEAALQVMQHLETDTGWSKDAETVLTHLDNDLNKLLQLLVSMLEKRDQWQPYLLYQDEAVSARSVLEGHIQTIINERLADLAACFPTAALTDLLPILRFAASQLANTDSPSPIKAMEFITAPPRPHYDDLAIWQAMAECLLTKSESTWRSRVDKSIGFPSLDGLSKAEKAEHQAIRHAWKTLVDRLSENETLRSALIDVQALPQPHYTEQQWKVLQSLLNLLKLLSAQLTVTFRQHGQIDFIENAQAAISALGHDDAPTDLALLLDYQIKHILMDEFQDTAYTQYRLLHLLTIQWQPDDGRTLFVVGDPMQSIYRFRQAEVGLFLKLQEKGIHHLALHPLQLSVNFRSTAGIVEWNNHHFSRIFPPFHDVGTGAVKFHASTAFINPSDNSESAVTMLAFNDAAENAQANALAKHIEDTLTAHPRDTIAILVKSRSHLSDIIPALKAKQIRYQAVDIDPLADNPVIQDLYSLTAALLHPADRIAWLSVCRAPWCGLTLSDLLTLPTYCLDDKATPALSEDGLARYRHTLDLLKKARYQRERYSLREWIEQTWLALGGARCVDSDGLESANTYFELLEKIQRDDPAINARRLKQKLEKLYANPSTTDARVQLMTIHSAKGLEFDTVIVPHLERKNRNDDAVILRWMERPSNTREATLLLAPIHEASESKKEKLYAYIESQDRIKADYELNRLLYVATTRAKKRLILAFDLKSKENDAVSLQHGSFLSKLYPHLVKASITLETTSATNRDEGFATRKPRGIQRLATLQPPPESSLYASVFMGTQSRQGFELKDPEATLVGTVVHRLLQQLSLTGASSWPTQPAEQSKLIEACYRCYGVTHRASSTTEHIQTLINNVLKDDIGQWLLQPHEGSAAEYPLSLIQQGKTSQLIIDRTFIDEAGTRWIIDYKTTPFSEGDLAVFLAEEKEKHQAQMALYRTAMESLENRPIQLGLYFPAIPAWCLL